MGSSVPLTETEKTIYVALWNMQSDVPVVYKPSWPEMNGEAGVFVTDDNGTGSKIWLQRDPTPDSDEPDLLSATLDELIILARERGHEASFRAGTYDKTIAEEHRAWGYAEALLRAQGFERWEVFHLVRTVDLERRQQRVSGR